MKHHALILATAAILLAASTAQAREYHVSEDAPACRDKDFFMKIVMAKADGDTEAVNKLTTLADASGTCMVFSPGEQVFVTDTTLSGLVKIRRKGNVAEYWTESDWIK